MLAYAYFKCLYRPKFWCCIIMLYYLCIFHLVWPSFYCNIFINECKCLRPIHEKITILHGIREFSSPKPSSHLLPLAFLSPASLMSSAIFFYSFLLLLSTWCWKHLKIKNILVSPTSRFIYISSWISINWTMIHEESYFTPTMHVLESRVISLVPWKLPMTKTKIGLILTLLSRCGSMEL